MKTYVLLIAGCLLIFLSSCATYQKAPLTSDDYNPVRQEVIKESLFQDKDRTISEEDIRRLLDGKIDLPDTIRIAVFKYASTSNRSYYNYYWSNEEYLKLQEKFLESLMGELESSDRVQKVVLVPSVMISSKPNITQLREAAVRLQADMLFVYTISSNIYYKNKAFQKNEAKAFATCETLLMDTRTGVIPHSTVVSRDMLVVKEQEDWDNAELRKRAENGAIQKSLEEAGKQTRLFLDGSD